MIYKAGGDANDAAWLKCRLPTYNSNDLQRLLVMPMMLLHESVGC